MDPPELGHEVALDPPLGFDVDVVNHVHQVRHQGISQLGGTRSTESGQERETHRWDLGTKVTGGLVGGPLAVTGQDVGGHVREKRLGELQPAKQAQFLDLLFHALHTAFLGVGPQVLQG